MNLIHVCILLLYFCFQEKYIILFLVFVIYRKVILYILFCNLLSICFQLHMINEKERETYKPWIWNYSFCMKSNKTEFKLHLGSPQKSTLKLYKPSKDQGVQKWIGRAHNLYLPPQKRNEHTWPQAAKSHAKKLICLSHTKIVEQRKA